MRSMFEKDIHDEGYFSGGYNTVYGDYVSLNNQAITYTNSYGELQVDEAEEARRMERSIHTPYLIHGLYHQDPDFIRQNVPAWMIDELEQEVHRYTYDYEITQASIQNEHGRIDPSRVEHLVISALQANDITNDMPAEMIALIVSDDALSSFSENNWFVDGYEKIYGAPFDLDQSFREYASTNYDDVNYDLAGAFHKSDFMFNEMDAFLKNDYDTFIQTQEPKTKYRPDWFEYKEIERPIQVDIPFDERQSMVLDYIQFSMSQYPEKYESGEFTLGNQTPNMLSDIQELFESGESTSMNDIDLSSSVQQDISDSYQQVGELIESIQTGSIQPEQEELSDVYGVHFDQHYQHQPYSLDELVDQVNAFEELMLKQTNDVVSEYYAVDVRSDLSAQVFESSFMNDKNGIDPVKIQNYVGGHEQIYGSLDKERTVEKVESKQTQKPKTLDDDGPDL